MVGNRSIDLYFIIDFYKSLSTADGERVFEARVITSFTDFDQHARDSASEQGDMYT